MSGWTATGRVAAISLGVSVLIGLFLVQDGAGITAPFEIPVYRHLILFQDFHAVVPFIAVLLAALIPQVRALASRLALECGRHVWTVAVVATVAMAVSAHSLYAAHPLTMDEYAVLFQSKVFAAGRLAGQFPPELMDWLVPQFLEGRFFTLARHTGRIASAYWPAFSLLLTPFTALGVPWLLNPLIGGATLVVMHRIALSLFGDPMKAGLVVLLTLASPAVTVNAASYYTMPAHLLANALFMLLLLGRTPWRAFFAGLAGSIALTLHNPVPHLLFALPWVVWLAFQPSRGRLIGALLAGYLPLCALLGWGWAIFIQGLGDATSAGVAVTAGAALMSRLASIFGWTSSTGFATHAFDLGKLWLWAAPALLTMAAWGAWQRRNGGGVWRAMTASALLTYFGYFIVQFDQGHGWGFRYFHSSWAVLPLLAVGALPEDARKDGDPLAGYLAACALLSLVFLTGLRALQVQQFVARHFAQAPVAEYGEPRVAIVNTSAGYYSWDLVQNDPFLRDPLIILASRGAQADRILMAQRFAQYVLLSSSQRGSVWGIPRRRSGQD